MTSCLYETKVSSLLDKMQTSSSQSEEKPHHDSEWRESPPWFRAPLCSPLPDRPSTTFLDPLRTEPKTLAKHLLRCQVQLAHFLAHLLSVRLCAFCPVWTKPFELELTALSIFLLQDRVSCRPSWLQTHYLAKGDLDLVIILFHSHMLGLQNRIMCICHHTQH